MYHAGRGLSMRAVDCASDPMARQILVFGGGGHARACIDLLRADAGAMVVGVLDSDRPVGTLVAGVPVLGDDSMDAMRAVFDSGVREAVVGVGAIDQRRRRLEIADALRTVGFKHPVLVHRGASVEASATIGAGTQVMAGGVVSSGAVVGEICIVNYNAVVSHDCRLADNVNLAPGAILGGWATVGAHTLIGMGVTVYRAVAIGADVLIANGCHISTDVAADAVIKRR
jgi:sugar O-acyltransferase (sialic acid O-acetyltransferase NeuD family)